MWDSNWFRIRPYAYFMCMFYLFRGAVVHILMRFSFFCYTFCFVPCYAMPYIFIITDGNGNEVTMSRSYYLWQCGFFNVKSSSVCVNVSKNIRKGNRNEREKKSFRHYWNLSKLCVRRTQCVVITSTLASIPSNFILMWILWKPSPSS